VSSFTHYNRRGDVTAKTDSAGKITYQAKYEAFGKRTSETGETLDRQKSNTKDEDIPGYANEGFRFRDLETGTFISKDPLGFVDGPNVYAYVVQNPWTKFDPEGLFWSAAINIGFAAWDTYQVATGGISGGEYAGRMALTGAALVADAATGGMGGGVALRAASVAARAGKVGQMAVKAAIAVDKADTAVSAGQAVFSAKDAIAEGDYGRAALSAGQVVLSAKNSRENTEQLVDGMKPKNWSPTHSQNQKMTGEGEQSHHIIQDAAVKDQPGYSYGSAPTTKLEGGSHVPGSPHDIANKMQSSLPSSMRGTYGGEKDAAYLSLRAAGQNRATAGANVQRADSYFKGELKMNEKTPTRDPND
jgi:RHS repeat-associated protein